MKMMIRAVMALAGLVFAGPALASPPPAIYTAVQATAGAAVFSANCAMCHGADMKGAAAPALRGQAFASVASKTSVGGVFSLVAEQMPANNPGGLTHEQYVQVMAYILSKNGYPAGSAPLDYNASLSSTLPLVSQVP